MAFNFLASSSASEEIPRPEFRGYTKTFFSGLHADDPLESPLDSDSSTQGIVQNRFRVEMLWEPSHSIAIEAAYDLSPTLQSQDSQDLTLFNSFEASPYRIGDLKDTFYPRSGEPEGSFFIAQNLDRLNLSYAAPNFDLCVGRQAIAWGAARTINPTDILAPFQYQELDKEERTGVDAIRLQIPLGEMSELDTGLVLGKDGKRGKSAAYCRFQGHWKATDFSVMAMGFRQNLMIGFDLSGAIGDAGFFFEAAHTWDSTLSSNQPQEPHDYARVSVGMDTNISEDFYGSIEYHYNGSGSKNPNDFIDTLGRTAYTEGNVFLLGKHYLSPIFTYQINPLWILSGSALINLSDPSALVSPALEYNPKEDVYLQIGAHLAIGDGLCVTSDPNFPIPVPEVEMGSEFGLYPDLYFTSIRIYF